MSSSDQRSSVSFPSSKHVTQPCSPVEEAHEKQLADLNRLFKKISDDVAWGTQKHFQKVGSEVLARKTSGSMFHLKRQEQYAVSFPTLYYIILPKNIPKSSKIQKKNTQFLQHQIAHLHKHFCFRMWWSIDLGCWCSLSSHPIPRESLQELNLDKADRGRAGAQLLIRLAPIQWLSFNS